MKTVFVLLSLLVASTGMAAKTKATKPNRQIASANTFEVFGLAPDASVSPTFQSIVDRNGTSTSDCIDCGTTNDYDGEIDYVEVEGDRGRSKTCAFASHSACLSVMQRMRDATHAHPATVNLDVDCHIL